MKALCYRELSDFVDYLRRLKYPEEEISKVVAHENAHLNKARELGYEAEYCIIFTESTELRTRPSIHIYGSKKLSVEDAKKISSATEDPSDWDTDVSRLKSLEAAV